MQRSGLLAGEAYPLHHRKRLHELHGAQFGGDHAYAFIVFHGFPPLVPADRWTGDRVCRLAARESSSGAADKYQ